MGEYDNTVEVLKYFGIFEMFLLILLKTDGTKEYQDSH